MTRLLMVIIPIPGPFRFQQRRVKGWHIGEQCHADALLEVAGGAP